MKRRSFVKNIGGLGLAPLMLEGLPIKSFADAAMLPLLACQGINDRVLVILFLKGANDGMNTVMPINQYDTYATLRPNIKLNEQNTTNGMINLDSTLPLDRQVGIHPSMTKFKEMYDASNATVLQGVGYPTPNKSHFKATDLWLTGGDGTSANFNIDSGWVGRYLDSAYPGVNGVSTPDFPDPLGLQFGDIQPSFSLYNHAQEFEGLNLTNQNLGSLSGLLSGIGSAPHVNLGSSDINDQISFIMGVENSTNSYGARITSTYNAGSNSSVTYPNSDLARQFQAIARLMKGGNKTKVFLAHKGGFDTHVNQVVSTASHTGTHANLLKDVFDSIAAFHADLANLGLDQKVVTVTFSEFGRKMIQNGSTGTDHGNYAPLFLFGTPVKAGVIGNNVNLTKVTADGNLVENGVDNQLQFDYRQIFKSLLKDWLGAGQTIITGTSFDPYTPLTNLLENSSVVDPTCYINPICYTYVTTADDNGNGSLRNIIDCAPANAEVKIAVSDKIKTTTGVIAITKNAKIIPYNNSPIIQAIGSDPIFTIAANTTLEISNMELIGNSLSSAIINNGTLILTNCTIRKSGTPSIPAIENKGTLRIKGNTVIGY